MRHHPLTNPLPSPVLLTSPTATMASASPVTPVATSTTAPPPSTAPIPSFAGLAAAKRSSKTCCTCRARKVRCDGRREICANCERLGFSCSYDEFNAEIGGLGPDGVPTFSLPRRRVRQACVNCHSRKARCSGTTPKCARCMNQGLECVYRPSRRTRMATSGSIGGGGSVVVAAGNGGNDSPSSGPDHPPDGTLHSPRATESRGGSSGAERLNKTSPDTFAHDVHYPPDALISRTLDAFFKHVHHIPTLSFLHRASLMQRLHAGLLDRPLLLAIIAITSLLTDTTPEGRAYGEKCADEAESLILSDFDKPSTVKVQALVLVLKHRSLCRRTNSAFMLLAVASRFAAILRLNHEQPQLCFLAQESRRRLMWALYMIDSVINSGYADFALWSADRVRVQLPCNERNYEFDLAQVTQPLKPNLNLPPSEDIGSLAMHVRIIDIRSRIMSFGKVAIQASSAELVNLPETVSELARALDDFAARLPASFRYSESNLRLRAYSPRLSVFAMIHIWWRQCHIDLYRLCLRGIVEALPSEALERCDANFLALCRRKCLEHANALADIFAALVQLDTRLPVTDLDLPVCAYQCARTLHYTYHTAGDDLDMTPEDVLERTALCLSIAKASCNGCPAALMIQKDLERLMRHGLSTDTTPSRAGTPDGGHSMKDKSGLDGGHVLSRHSTIKQMEIIEDTGIGPPPAHEGCVPDQPAAGVSGADERLETVDGEKQVMRGLSTQQALPQRFQLISQTRQQEQQQQQQQQQQPMHLGSVRQPPPKPQMELPIHVPAGLPAAVDLTNNNNAFEGAMDDEFGFGPDMEPFGLDNLTWFSGEWLGAELNGVTVPESGRGITFGGV